MLGAYAGNRLGAVRDAKGKSVAAVFSDLGGTQKAEVSRNYDHDALLCISYPFLDITCTSHESFRICDVITPLLPWTPLFRFSNVINDNNVHRKGGIKECLTSQDRSESIGFPCTK
jgi:hypothetical protein